MGICNTQNDEDTPYTCTCLQGYSGNNCQFNTTTTTTASTTTVQSPCFSLPCQNNGVCVTLTATTYVCQCIGSYIGTNCQIANLCATTTCQNGGTCNVAATGTSAYCTCVMGYSGAFCQTCTSLLRLINITN